MKKAHRGKKGKMSAFVHDMKRKLDQGIRTSQLRKQSRQERSADPVVPVERVLVPALHHDPKAPSTLVHPSIVEYYQKIGPLEHPCLEIRRDRRGNKRVVARRDISEKKDKRGGLSHK